ncbi:hypothetical protein M427DRAFT_396780 [Gonapodya prolifera JEL478]|uniref:Uncharacterized protein n=1 Tax=Gonapodya prolifera (strain JEL478) TaxID=1344416 RepID=A0A139A6G2_GONPJ|nr:hypothetical protein M427DRAFT_396780 [Gonapodya prolifera JEL478]|eukprot:KXS12392.1 hypothetical protein M427DRAFT_396780 [Gonapodya prolifera JEL478]
MNGADGARAMNHMHDGEAQMRRDDGFKRGGGVRAMLSLHTGHTTWRTKWSST